MTHATVGVMALRPSTPLVATVNVAARLAHLAMVVSRDGLCLLTDHNPIPMHGSLLCLTCRRRRVYAHDGSGGWAHS